MDLKNRYTFAMELAITEDEAGNSKSALKLYTESAELLMKGAVVMIYRWSEANPDCSAKAGQ